MPQKKRTVKGVLGGLLGLVGLSAVAGVLATAAVTPAIAIAGVTGSQALSIFDNLPNSLTPGNPIEPTVFYATGEDGKQFQLATFYDQNRVPVTFDEISPLMYDAILSSEDKNFYSHGGINLGATVKAVIDNLRKTSSRGASTISQQFVKNVLIQECEQEVSPNLDDDKYQEELASCWTDATNAVGAAGIERKLQEMRYAIQIEKDYSKNDILLGYLNIANFGGQVYGIEAAANYYFGTTAKKLTLTQAATLAGIVQNPNVYRIDKKDGSWTDKTGKVRNSEEDGYADARDRRNYVLNRMFENGQITAAQHTESIESPVVPSIHPTTQGCKAAGDQAYFCQYAKSFIENDEAFGKTPKERQALLKRGGLKVYTSLDMRVQRPGAQAMAENAPVHYKDWPFAASGVTIESATGRVLAIVQNTQFNETASADKSKGQIGQVYAADIAHNGAGGFGPGSAYKVFTLLDWLEKGHSVNEVLDGRWRLFTPFTICGEAQPNSSKTENYARNGGYVGTPMRFTAQSLNTGFYAMAQQLDLCDINKLAARMGVHLGNTDPVTDENGPFATVLGSKQIAPIQMASVYGTIGNNGVYCPPRAIDKVVGPDGTEMALPKSSCSQVIAPEVAATAAYALQGVLNATGSAANPRDGVPLIGKTGTNEKWGTAMALASSKTATFVYAGTSGSTKFRVADAYWEGKQMSQIRFPISRTLQHAANQAYGGDRFPEPDRNLTRRVLKDLPSVVGQSIEDATRTLEGAGFSVQVGSPIDSQVEAGHVAEQQPGAGRVPGGTTVTLAPSTGKEPEKAVPNVVGSKFKQAKKALEGAGFSVDGEDCSGGAKVEAQDPAGGKAPPGSTVVLTCESDD